MVGRETQAVNEQLPAIQGAEVAGRRIAEADHAQQRVVSGIRHRDGVGKLFGRVHPVAVGDGNFRRRDGPGTWPAKAAARGTTPEQRTQRHSHLRSLPIAWRITAISCV